MMKVFVLVSMTLFYLTAFCTIANSHEWYMDKRNPVTHYGCCDGEDCKVITEDMWWQEGKDIKVRWFDGEVYSIPANQALPSEDRMGRAAACVLYGNLRCFFLPAMF